MRLKHCFSVLVNNIHLVWTGLIKNSVSISDQTYFYKTHESENQQILKCLNHFISFFRCIFLFISKSQVILYPVFWKMLFLCSIPVNTIYSKMCCFALKSQPWIGLILGNMVIRSLAAKEFHYRCSVRFMCLIFGISISGITVIWSVIPLQICNTNLRDVAIFLHTCLSLYDIYKYILQVQMFSCITLYSSNNASLELPETLKHKLPESRDFYRLILFSCLTHNSCSVN